MESSSWGLNFCASIDLGFQLSLNLGLGCGNLKVSVSISFYVHGFLNYQLGISTLIGVRGLVLEIQKSGFLLPLMLWVFELVFECGRFRAWLWTFECQVFSTTFGT